MTQILEQMSGIAYFCFLLWSGTKVQTSYVAYTATEMFIIAFPSAEFLSHGNNIHALSHID